MGIGAGIVVATCILIAAWQIDKRKLWRRALNLAFGCIGVAIIAGLGMYGYSEYENYRENQAKVAEAQLVRNSQMLSLAGVKLGQTRSEVEYQLGTPSELRGRTPIWKHASGFRAVLYTDEGVVRVIMCVDPGFSSECGSVAGISTTDPETKVLSVLGEPITPPEFDGPQKTITFGTALPALDVQLTQGRVSGFILYSEPKRGSPLAEAPPRGTLQPKAAINPSEVTWDSAPNVAIALASAQDAASKTWADVVAQPEYRGLPTDVKIAAKNQYWNEQLKPRLPNAIQLDAYRLFMSTN